MKFEPRYTEENFNVHSQNHLWVFVRLSLWLLGIVLCVYFVLGFAADKIAERLPSRFESAIAIGFNSGIDSNAFPRTREYQQKILDSLVSASEGLPEFRYRVSVYDSDMVNAVALPAGNIVVFRGLLSEVKSEDELAMILAHELGHYAHRDHLRGLGRGLVLLSIMAALGVSGDVPGFISPSVQTFDLKYSRAQESAADVYATDLLKRAYGHVGGALSVFKVLERQEKGVKGPDMFSTHPDTLWRIQTLENYVQQKRYPNGAVRPLPDPGVLPFPDDKSGNRGKDGGSK